MKKTLKRLLCTALVFILAFGSIFVTSNATDGWETTTGVVTPPDEPKSERMLISNAELITAPAKLSAAHGITPSMFMSARLR